MRKLPLVVRLGLLVKAFQEEKLSLHEALESSAVTKIKSTVDSWRDFMEHNYRTAKLWLQYQRMIQILRSFLRSIRTGDWKLYLKSMDVDSMKVRVSFSSFQGQ